MDNMARKRVDRNIVVAENEDDIDGYFFEAVEKEKGLLKHLCSKAL